MPLLHNKGGNAMSLKPSIVESIPCPAFSLGSVRFLNDSSLFLDFFPTFVFAVPAIEGVSSAKVHKLSGLTEVA